MELSGATATARTTDPSTSHEAAASITGLRERQRRILEILRASDGMTDEELVAAYVRSDAPYQTPQSVRSRRSELRDLGLVRDTSRRRPMRSGRQAIVWVVETGPIVPRARLSAREQEKQTRDTLMALLRRLDLLEENYPASDPSSYAQGIRHATWVLSNIAAERGVEW